MMRNNLLLLIFCLIPALSGADTAFNARVLNEVWDAVARNHFRKDFQEVYRQSVYEKFRPEVLQSPDRASLTANLNRMLEAIGDSHLRVFGPDNDPRTKKILPVENPGDGRIPADPGFSILGCGDRLLVRAVRPGSAAAQSGVQPGDILLAAEGLEVKYDPESLYPESMIFRNLLERGGPDSICRVRLQRRDGTVRDLRLKRSANGGRRVSVPGIPPVIMHCESRRLDAKTGYFRLNVFEPSAIRQFRKERKKGIFRNMEQLIIDLRGNPGGLMITAEWLAAWSIPRPVSLGIMEIAGTRLAPVSAPQKDGFSGRLIVLVDQDSLSTSEIFAAAIQDTGNGIVVGSATPGKCLPSMFLTLPCGFRVQIISGSISRPSGKGIEKTGVRPDIAVQPGFDGSEDRVLAKAMAIFAEKGKIK